jgi:hypothetical protein
MLSPVKTLGFFTFLLLLHYSSDAQFKLNSRGTNDFVTDVKKVIQDHSNHYQNIIGEQIVANPQSTEYSCKLKIEGAEESSITKYSSGAEEMYSWQALMLTTENFNEAKRKFRSLFDQFNNLSILSSQLKGTYEMPVEEKKFTSVIFSISPDAEATAKLKVEITIEAEGMEWKVKVLIYDREREDNEKGKIVE